MTDHSHLVRRALVRPTFTALMLTVMYFVVPLDGAADLGAVTLLVVVLFVVVLLCTWQARSIVRAEHPVIRGMEALAAVVPTYIVGFSATYYSMAAASAANFSEPVSRMGSLYFTLSVFSTAGFGDITASTDFSRAVVSLQMVGNLIIIAIGGRLLVAVVRRGQARNAR